MKKLTKKYALVYNEEAKMIIAKTENCSIEFPMYVGGNDIGVEFDTSQELEDYISENNLTE